MANADSEIKLLHNRTRVVIDGVQITLGNPDHPFYELNKKSGISAVVKAMGLDSDADVALALKNWQKHKAKHHKGLVYVIRNAAWPDWYKIGVSCKSMENRLEKYNFCSPLRDFVVCHAETFDDAYGAEKAIHFMLKQHKDCHDNNGEWFKTYVPVIQEVMSAYKEETGQAS